MEKHVSHMRSTGITDVAQPHPLKSNGLDLTREQINLCREMGEKTFLWDGYEKQRLSGNTWLV